MLLMGFMNYHVILELADISTQRSQTVFGIQSFSNIARQYHAIFAVCDKELRLLS